MKGNESVWTKIMRNKSFSNQSNYRIFSQRLLLDNWDPFFFALLKEQALHYIGLIYGFVSLLIENDKEKLLKVWKAISLSATTSSNDCEGFTKFHLSDTFKRVYFRDGKK